MGPLEGIRIIELQGIGPEDFSEQMNPQALAGTARQDRSAIPNKDTGRVVRCPAAERCVLRPGAPDG